MHESTILNKACSVVLHVLRNYTRFSLDDNDNFGRIVVRDPAIKHFDAFGFPARSFVVIELVGKFGKGVADVQRADNGFEHLPGGIDFVDR